MLVILKRVFFCGGNRYRSIGKSAVEIPDKFKDILPAGAVIVDKNNDPIVEGVDAPEDSRTEEEKARAEEEKARAEEEAAKENEKYVNPAHELDADRQFAEALSEMNEKAADEVDNLREQLKGSKKK